MSNKSKETALTKQIKEYLTVYLPVIKKRSPNTITTSRSSLNLFLEFLKEDKGLPIGKVTKTDFNQENLVEFQRWMQTKPFKSRDGRKVSTINLRISRLKGFCKYLAKNDVLDYVWIEEIKEINNIKETELKDFVYLTIEQVKLILEQPNLSKKTGIRDRFFIALMYESGCRVDELLHLKVSDYKLNKKDEGSISVFGKGNKFRCTPLSDKITPLYKEYMSIFHPGEVKTSDSLMFYTVRNDIKAQMSADNVERFLRTYEKSAKKIDSTLPHLHAHLFRRTRAMHLYMAGTPLPLVQEWLGHSYEETTRIYAKATDDMKRQALQKLGENENSIVDFETPFKYLDNDEILMKLAGLK